MKRAILLVDHGSKLAEANALLEAVAGRLRRTIDDPVYVCHMELAEPSLGRAFETAADDGAEEIVVHPYFLGPGRHSTTDIPRLVAEAGRSRPGVRWRITPPLGVHDHIVAVVRERIAG